MVAVLAASCTEGKKRDDNARKTFRTEHVNRMTPVKDQGAGTACWAYAMLAAIETTHISMGDSVNLSPAWAVRALMEDVYKDCVLTRGEVRGSCRATGMTLLNIIRRHGIVPYDSYPDRDGKGATTTVMLNKARALAGKAVNARKGYEAYMPSLQRMLDETLGYKPKNVYMLGAQYTPVEFAHSVCRPGEYVALASVTHHPFGEMFDLEVADNWDHSLFLNVPIDTLTALIDREVRSGRGVCWEGDISEPGFSFADGVATLDIPEGEDVQALRQMMIETYSTTDDHAMAVVGIARDERGVKYFIMKNSWGTDNPYGGLMYVSEDYVRLKTVTVLLHRDCVIALRQS